MHLNENKTLKEIKEKGFVFNNTELLYYVREGAYLAFDLDVDSECFLKYIGQELFALINTDEQEHQEEIKKTIKKLKDDNFILESR